MNVYGLNSCEFEKNFNSKVTVSLVKTIREGFIAKQKWVKKNGIGKKQLNSASPREGTKLSYVTVPDRDSTVKVPRGYQIAFTDFYDNILKYKRSSEKYYPHPDAVVAREVKV